MLDHGGHVTCCDDSAGSGTAELIARRRLLKAAVLAPRDAPGQISTADGAGAPPGPAPQPRVLTGTVVDASPHVLTLSRADGEERLALMPGTKAWKGGPVDPTALGAGDRVVVRLHRSRRGVAGRVWANIGRVTGVILERDREGIVVDAGKNRGRQVILSIGRHGPGAQTADKARKEAQRLLGLIRDGKDPAAKALGKKGGAARARAMTPERRAEVAKKAAGKRWEK